MKYYKPKKLNEVVNVRPIGLDRYVIGNPIKVTYIQRTYFEGIDTDGEERTFNFQEFEVTQVPSERKRIA